MGSLFFVFSVCKAPNSHGALHQDQDAECWEMLAAHSTNSTPPNLSGVWKDPVRGGFHARKALFARSQRYRFSLQAEPTVGGLPDNASHGIRISQVQTR